MLEIIKKLKDNNPEIRESGLDEIGILKPSNALKLIVPFLSDLNSEVRETAACNLGLIKDEHAVPYLVDTVNSDPSEKVRAEALLSLAEYHGEIVLECLINEVRREKRSRRPRQEVAKQLGNYNTEESIECLVILLQDEDVHVRIPAVDSLFKLNRASLREVWLWILREEPSEYVFEIAKKAIAELDKS